MRDIERTNGKNFFLEENLLGGSQNGVQLKKRQKNESSNFLLQKRQRN